MLFLFCIAPPKKISNGNPYDIRIPGALIPVVSSPIGSKHGKMAAETRDTKVWYALLGVSYAFYFACPRLFGKQVAADIPDQLIRKILRCGLFQEA